VRTVADAPLTGRATRLDYQSFDPQGGRLYVAHLGDDMLTVFDTNPGKVVGDVRNLKSVHGVLAVPELHRVYLPLEDGRPPRPQNRRTACCPDAMMRQSSRA
jgi:hypothetical protein